MSTQASVAAPAVPQTQFQFGANFGMGLPGSTTDGASVSAAPGGMQMPPQPLTVGMPDPDTIVKQKTAYMKMLDEQFKQGVSVLDAQTKHQKEFLSSQAQQQKAQFVMQLDIEVKQQEMVLEQQRQEQLMQLQQQASQQKAALEQQSMQLVMEYQQKKAEEEMQKQQYDMERQQQEMQVRMAQEMQKFSGASGMGGQRAGGSLFSGIGSMMQMPGAVTTTTSTAQ